LEVQLLQTNHKEEPMLQNSVFASPFLNIVCPGSELVGHIGSSLWVVTANGPTAGSLLIGRNVLGLYYDFGEHITGESRVEIQAGTIVPEELGAVIVYHGQAVLCPYRHCPVAIVVFETECEVEIDGCRYIMSKTPKSGLVVSTCKDARVKIKEVGK
jgi:hypothetical protein